MYTAMAGVKLRIQKRDNNKGHYYLDYYLGSKMVNGKQVAQRKREGLGLDIYLNPKNNIERDHNKKNKNFAEAIHREREYDFMTSTHNLPNKNKGNKSFTEYFLEFATKKNLSEKVSRLIP